MAWLRAAASVALTACRRPFATHRLRVVVDRQRDVKIEVGAGGHRSGWIDTNVTWRARHYMDATTRWPFGDGQASHVYADNVIEHLRMEPNRAVFREAHRVLRPGGRIRLVTPDVGRLVELYTAQSDESRWHLESARRSGYEVHHHVDLLRVVFQDAGHHVGYLWDFEALHQELKAAGFVEITTQRDGESDDPELRDLEARVSDRSIQLIVEAVRSGDDATP